MTGIGGINVTLQLCGVTLSLMIILCLYFGGNVKTRTSRLYVLLLVCNMCGMLFDALAYVFRGKEGFVASVGVRASNFLAFCSFCVFPTILLSYLNHLLRYVAPHHMASHGAMESQGHIGSASGHIEHTLRAALGHHANGCAAPPFVDAKGEDVVEQIVVAGYAIEHPLHLLALVVLRRAIWFYLCRCRLGYFLCD